MWLVPGSGIEPARYQVPADFEFPQSVLHRLENSLLYFSTIYQNRRLKGSDSIRRVLEMEPLPFYYSIRQQPLRNPITEAEN